MTCGQTVLKHHDRIAVTGMGVVSPIGCGLRPYWSALINGTSGISQIERFSTHGMRVSRGGEVKELDDSFCSGRPLPKCRASQFLVFAASEALRMAKWDDSLTPDSRLGVVVGTALGGIEWAERLIERPQDLHALVAANYDGPTRQLASWVSARGPAMTISTACASGASSLGVAADLLRAGAATAVLAGGVDILCRFVLTGFNRLRALTRNEVRPFDLRRNGLLLGEGAGIVLMERESMARRRGVIPAGFLLGHASCADGMHIIAPDAAGRGLETAIRLAMQSAGVTPKDIDFISAHGTGTPVNDRVETLVFKKVLGARAYDIPINSIKAHVGHTMGAAGTLEAIMCFLASQYGRLPATLNYAVPDPICDLDYVPAPRRHESRIILKTAVGFAGSNACLVLEGGEQE